MKDNFCEICKKKAYRYTCPKCGIVYCSVDCYKNHSEKCTETFYYENIERELKNQKVSEEEKKKFEKILSKLHQLEREGDTEEEEEDVFGGKDEDSVEEVEDSVEEEEEEERIKYLMKLAQKDILNENNLTEKEMKEFRSALKRGVLNKYMEVCSPWWLKVVSNPEEFKCSSNFSHICCSAKQKANTKVVWTITQIIYAYVHFFRTSNGDVFVDPIFAIQYILTIAQTLWKKEEEPSVLCIENVLMYVKQSPVLGDDRAFDVMCFIDVSKILSFKDFLLRCVHEVSKIVKIAKHELLKEEKNIDVKQTIERLFDAKKKLKFLNCFAFFHYDVFEAVRKKVDDIFDSHFCQIQQENYVDEKRAASKSNILKAFGCCSKLNYTDDEADSVLTNALGSISLSNLKKKNCNLVCLSNMQNRENKVEGVDGKHSSSDFNAASTDINNNNVKPLIEVIK